MNTGPNSQGATILIVDDEPQNLHLLGELLREEHEVLVAINGKEALKRARSDTPPDLILLDIMMPEMDGLQVCRELQDDLATRNIPLIFITAKDEVEDETEGLEAGAVDYITKPFSPAIVKARVRTHLKLKAQADLLANLSMLDGLTGLPNRRQFDQRLDSEWRRLTRIAGAFTIVMMDVDHFKLYNDHYGHLSGDECLRQVAAALASVVHRSADIVARYGGEEFVALLPTTDAAHGLEIAEQFRHRVEALGLTHQHSSAADCVTISIGVATCTPGEHSDPQALLQCADGMLYRAKEEGRNRIVSGTLDE